MVVRQWVFRQTICRFRFFAARHTCGFAPGASAPPAVPTVRIPVRVSPGTASPAFSPGRFLPMQFLHGNSRPGFPHSPGMGCPYPNFHFTDGSQSVMIKEALIKSARADGGRFCHSRRFENRGNTGCISRFSNCTDGAKDSPLSRRRFIQRFPRTRGLTNPSA